MHRIPDLLYKAIVLATSIRVTVSGWSMYPTLLAGEYILFNRWAYRRHNPERGDMVLVRGLLEGDAAMIKRVVGISMDEVRISRGIVTVNGEQVDMLIPTDEIWVERDGHWRVKQDEVFLLGDALDMSIDSRSFGPVSCTMVKARAWLICWPLSRWRLLDEENTG